MIQNPILPGFHADPCICRKGNDFYIAVSSFEWFPGIPIYHSRDMKSWELYSHALQNDREPDLRKLPSAKGIWAPCLTYCEADELFYVVYGVMNSMNARYFDVDNYLITAKDPKGPWSEPVYLHSTGFDASMFHDDDGKKYIVALDWETRTAYEKPGPINIVEYDPEKKTIVGMPKAFWRGGTDRGCIEAPHLTKRGDYYYIMCAEGGTGYYHSVTVGRSKNIWGPYEPDPCNPILTSSPGDFNERSDWDHLKPRYYNPDSVLQKSGHASYVDLSNGETWMVHLTARPFVPELRCTLGRETAIQRISKMALISDFTVVGIGGVDTNATIIKNSILTPDDYLLLKKQGAVGDILSHFIDINGNLIDTDLEKRLMSPALTDIEKYNNVVGVAGGPHKIEAIYAVLTGKYLDVLITDENTATAVLDLYQSKNNIDTERKDGALQ